MKLPDDDPIRAHVIAIRDASERASSLTHQLLAFSRKQMFRVRPVDINAVLEGMARMLRRIIGEDVVLEIRAGKSLPPVAADKGQIEQVLMNLAVNARDAMPQGGRLIVTTEAVPEGNRLLADDGANGRHYVLLAATDTGKGMSSDVRDRIFEPFFTTKEPGKGTGLGLSTVYGIVKQHNGHIAVDSEPGRGTTFRIYLPVAASEHVARQAWAASAMAGGTETVLLVEDDQTIRDLIREILTPLGYRVLSTESGEEALARYETSAETINLLLTDVIMPGMNGRMLAERMKEKRPDMRVLFMSGYPHDALSHQGLLGSGASLIHKPLGPSLLAAHVRRVLDSPA